MKHAYFGDSYDLVKRFFCTELASLGYDVIIDPMFTDNWHGAENAFYRLINAAPACDAPLSTRDRALFLDPDTGVNATGGRKHVSFIRLAKDALDYKLVISFDQSFTRRYKPETVMRDKLTILNSLGCYAMFYNSHARFLFVSSAEQPISGLREHLLSLGLPSSRLFVSGA